ncbi:MAG TPA: 3,4-dihydroxy-2-butanone-4-phosphate synthase, partial [Myxococcaceae bacterium]|nr:3,4-dihydroxy-2-butanone-4-phosphate synthase [Myxococcaceae bacterium]
MVILTDDEDRENEGDLVMAASKVTPVAINFMATHGRGLICLSLTEAQIQRLQLPLMVQDNTSPYQTAFTVSIEAAEGVTTGISAADRAHTIRVAAARDAKPTDLVRPGHIFPLRARDGGVLVRTGQTEGSVDLARLAGLPPAGVICEVMNPDGTMARRPELQKFARKHRLVLLSVADLIRYRLQRDRLVRRTGAQAVRRRQGGEFNVLTYASDVDPATHVAFVHGDVSGRRPVLTRVHRACMMGDVLGSGACDCGEALELAFRRIVEEGRGVLIYLQREAQASNRWLCSHAAPDEVATAGGRRGDPSELREFGLGAQMLRDLGLSRLRLLTNAPKKIVGLESYGLELVEQVPLGLAPVIPAQAGHRRVAPSGARALRRRSKA